MEDNEIYINNINSLKNRYQDIYSRLFNTTGIDENGLEIAVADARDGNKYMTIKKDGHEFYIHSRNRPLDEAKKWVDSIEIKDTSTFIIFGFGLGYHINELSRLIGKINRIVIYEPYMNIFVQTLHNFDCADIFNNENIILVVENEEELKNNIWANLHWININFNVYKSLPNYDRLFPEEYSNLLRIIKDITYIRVLDRNTIFYFSEKWQNNLFKNLPHIFNSSCVSNLFGKFSNKPAIIVAAGPSLNRNVKFLKDVKEKAIIICVGRALKVLLKEKITPDMIITLDGDVKSYEQFKNIEYGNIPLVYTSVVYPEILNDHKGEKIVSLIGDIYLSELFEKRNIDIGLLSTGGSVACAAFSLAVSMDADPVAFIGQDLAYTNNMSHAEGVEYKNSDINNLKGSMVIKDIYGNDVYTDESLYSFLVWFEKAIENDKSGRIYIDATEGGARIKGTEIMILSDFINKYCKEEIGTTERLKELLDENKPHSGDVLLSVIEEYEECLNEFKYIRIRTEEAIKYSKKLFASYRNRYTRNITHVLEKLDEYDLIVKEKREHFDLINYLLRPIIYDTLNGLNEEKSEDEWDKGMKAAQKSQLLYEAIGKAIDYASPLLKECIENLKEIGI